MSFNEISLAEAIEFVVDNRGKTVPVQEYGFPLIATNCVSNENLYPEFNNVRFVSEEIYENWFRSHPLPGDILLTNKGSKNGAICLVPNPVSFCIAQDMVALRAKTDVIYPKYLFAALRSNLVQSRIKELNVDSVIPHFKKTDFNKLFFPLPDYERQILIGDSYFNFCNKIELNRQTNQTLEQIAQTLFKSWFVDFDPVKAKIAAKQAGGNAEQIERAAMAAISGKTEPELDQLTPEQYENLKTTATLFPDELVDSELGEIPRGWEVDKVDSILNRLKPSKRYTKKQIEPIGKVPVYEQGTDILLGYHNDDAGFKATSEQPIFIFGDHTCITYLSCSEFDISQNVIPLQGNKYPTIWTFYAIQGKQTFQEYRRHWSELIIKKLVLPDIKLAKIFEGIVTDNKKLSEAIFNESERLKQTRDALLPKLLSGELQIETENVA